MSSTPIDEQKQEWKSYFDGHGVVARVLHRVLPGRFGGQWPPELMPGPRSGRFDATLLLIFGDKAGSLLHELVFLPHVEEALGRMDRARVDHANFSDREAFDGTHPDVACFSFSSEDELKRGWQALMSVRPA